MAESDPQPRNDSQDVTTAKHRKTSSSPGSVNYTFYDENYKPMWNRGMSRKIGESAFVQQNLPTYRLSWSPLKLCPILLLIGALFTGMGVGIKKFSDGIQELKIPYKDCMSVEDPSRKCSQLIRNSNATKELPEEKLAIFHMDANDIFNCTCLVNFTLEEPFKGTVYIYYGLINFYQNHKHYYLSRDENQLKGNLFSKGNPKVPSSACEPLNYEFPDKKDKGRIIYPCGLMANSMFTDVIDLYYYYYPEKGDVSRIRKKSRNLQFLENETINQKPNTEYSDEVVNMSVPLIKTGIAWDSDRDEKFAYPEEFKNENDTVWAKFMKPWGWKKTLWQLDPTNASNNGVLNEDFIVWMRTAAFPWFRKLYRIVDNMVVPFHNGLPAGNYSLRIQYNYDVTSFEGGKEIILTTSRIVGAKNMFLAIVYMSTGALCIFLSIVLFVAYKCCGLKHFSLDQIKSD